MKQSLIISLLLFLSANTCFAQEEPEPDTSYIEEADTAYWEPDVEYEEEEDTTEYENEPGSTTFEEFISYFTTVGLTSLEPAYTDNSYVLNRLPEGAIAQYIGFDAAYNAEGFYYAKEMLLETNYYFLLVYVFYTAAGPGVERVDLITYDRYGSSISGQVLGESFASSGPDGEGVETVYEYNSDRNFVKVTHTITSYDTETEQEVKRDEYDYYQIDSSGYINLIPLRLYPEASDHVLSESEVDRYTSEELLIMRNEVFASHGYIFKTEPLKTYFSNQIWYSPLFENVDDQLTEIEQVNLKLIKAVEKKKKSK